MFYTSDLFGFSALEDWLANIVEEKKPPNICNTFRKLIVDVL